MKIHTLWIWKRGMEGPDLARAWPEWEWPHGDPDAIESMVGDAVSNWSPLSSLGYRLVEINIDYDPIERAFYDVPQVDGSVRVT